MHVIIFKHVIKNLTANIIVTSKVFIGKPKLKYKVPYPIHGQKFKVKKVLPLILFKCRALLLRLYFNVKKVCNRVA